MQGGEGQVLELPPHLLHPQTVRQGCVHVERLLRRTALLPFGHDGQGPHVVQAVGQLDQQDTPIVGHGHEHLANSGGLVRLLGVELETVQLGDPVHHLGHPGAERLADGLEGETGILHGVMEECGRDGLRVESELGHNGGHGNRVRNVGLSGTPELAVVSREGGPGGRHNGSGGVIGPVTAEFGQQGSDHVFERALPILCDGSHPSQGHHPSTLPAQAPHPGDTKG